MFCSKSIVFQTFDDINPNNFFMKWKENTSKGPQFNDSDKPISY